MLELMAEARAQGLPEHHASQVLRVSPRTQQRWRQPASPKAPAVLRPRPINALIRDDAAAVASAIRIAPADHLGHADAQPGPHRQQAEILIARQARHTQPLDQRRDANHTPFTLEDLITQTLPDVSQCLDFSWAGPNAISQSTRHPLRS